MKPGSRLFDFVSLTITYLVVKIGHAALGFQYDFFSKEMFSVNLLIDVLSWAVVYTLVRYLLKKIAPSKESYS
ncbi:hypothetical protein [Rufibacter roseus]|uniref:Uncharacterized protein n=1 Tax=Rufibacter roseus TaxID=1567108 RepID=A0ABW2DR18_9BACT|nr:hypothetical protein [Rufibacter roseus]